MIEKFKKTLIGWVTNFNEMIKLSNVNFTQECWEQYWTSPGGNTPQDTNRTATCHLSRKLFKLDEPDMRNTAGEAGTNS